LEKGTKETNSGRRKEERERSGKERWHQALLVTHQAAVLNGLNKQSEQGIMKMPPPGRHRSSLTFPGCRV